MSKKLNIRPTTSVYATYKRMDYKIHSAIAEFVDNSTQSYFDHRKVLLETKYFKLKIDIDYEYTDNGDRLIIKDNAYGMNYHDFQRALILDRPPINDGGRNQFGMGLKTASSWFGDKWSVRTTELGSHVEYFAEIDIDILQKYKNEEITVEENHSNPKEHYTIITIERLNQKLANQKSDTINKKIKKKIVERLSSIYREDLRTNEIEINFMGESLRFEEPPILEEVLPNGKIKKWRKNIDFTIEHNDKNLAVTGFIAIRIPASISNAGFTLLQNKRVIVGGPDSNYRPQEIFGKANSFAYQRLYGELNLEHWPVTQSKDAFAWENNGLEEKFLQRLIEETKEYVTKAIEYRPPEDKVNYIVDEETFKKFEKGGLIENVSSIKIKRKKTSEITTKNTKFIPESPLNESENTLPNDKLNEINAFEFTFYNEKLTFLVDTDETTKYDNWLSTTKEVTDDGTKYYHIKLNLRHEFFQMYKLTKDFISFLKLFSIAMIIAELRIEYVSDKDPSGIRTGLNEILNEITLKKKDK